MATVALTREWELRTGENSIKYTVAVDDFGEKIVSFPAGETICSKDIQVGGSVFRLVIYPSGKKINSTDVSVFLANLSDREVIADVKFQVGDRKRELPKQRKFGKITVGGNCWGFSKMVPHARCIDGDLLRDGVLEIDVFIDLDVEDLGNSKMKTHVDKKFEVLEKKIDQMDRRMATIEAGGVNRDLQCPVCFETVKPPMRLNQCGQGHIICDDCHRQRISYNPVTGRTCHTCKGPITGRPSALEQLAGLI